MNEEELKEILKELREQGWTRMVISGTGTNDTWMMDEGRRKMLKSNNNLV